MKVPLGLRPGKAHVVGTAAMAVVLVVALLIVLVHGSPAGQKTSSSYTENGHARAADSHSVAYASTTTATTTTEAPTPTTTGPVTTVASTVPAAADQVGAPTSGALFGLFPGSDAGASGPTFTSYLPAMVQWQGRNNDVINVYDQLQGSTNSGASIWSSWLPTIWDKEHSVPMISFNIATGAVGGYSVADVIDGKADRDLSAWAKNLSKWLNATDALNAPAPAGGRRVYIRFDWEANANWYGWSATQNPNLASRLTCAQLQSQEAAYVQMWRHVHDVVMSAATFDTAQVAWVFSVYSLDVGVPSGCSSSVSDVISAIYPGDSYVDWVGVDGYAYDGVHYDPSNCQVESVSSQPYLSPPASIFGCAIDELQSLSTRPLSIDEVGATAVDDSNWTAGAKGNWIASYFSYIEQKGVMMSLWFNYDDSSDAFSAFSKSSNMAHPNSNGDCQFSTGGSSYLDYCQYASGVGSSYFVSPDPANPRLLTDQQFLEG
jgi:hypothetical protein